MSESSLESAVPRPAATAGLLAAALAIVGAVPNWPGSSPVAVESVGSPIALGIAVIAAIVFTARRRGFLSRRVGAVAGGFAGIAILGFSIYRLLAPAVGSDTAAPLGYGLPITAIAGLLCVGLAVADARGVSGDQLVGLGRYVGMAIVLTAGSQVVLVVVGSILGLGVRAVTDEVMQLALSVVLSPASEIALAVLAVWLILRSGRGWEYLDTDWPDLKDVGLMAVGVFALLVVQFAVIGLIQVLDLPSSSNSIVEVGQRASDLGQPEIVLLMVPMMILVVGPAEELLFRNVIQKYLYDVFDKRSAVLVASIIFALAHIPAYFAANTAGLFVSLTTIFVLSLVLGSLYVYRESIVVVAVAHGVYNAILVVFLYLSLKFGESLDPAVLF